MEVITHKQVDEQKQQIKQYRDIFSEAASNYLSLAKSTENLCNLLVDYYYTTGGIRAIQALRALNIDDPFIGVMESSVSNVKVHASNTLKIISTSTTILEKKKSGILGFVDDVTDAIYDHFKK